MKVDVDVLGFQSLTVLLVCVDVKNHLKKKKKNQKYELLLLLVLPLQRPTPKMTLIRPSGDVIANVPQGTPTLADEIKEVTGEVTVQCRDTGVYHCDVNNGVGSTQPRNVTIVVQCKSVCHTILITSLTISILCLII